jgi:hypothetical protein
MHVRSETRNVPPAEVINPVTGLPYLEADSQEFKAGDMVYLNGGAVTQVLTAGQLPILGFAMTNATNVTSGNIPIRVMPVVAGDVYAMNIWSGTEGNTNPDDIALLVGKYVNLRQVTVTEQDGSTTYCTAIDIDTQTIARVLIVGIEKINETVATSTYIRALVKFSPSIMVTGLTPTYTGLQFDA